MSDFSILHLDEIRGTLADQFNVDWLYRLGSLYGEKNNRMANNALQTRLRNFSLSSLVCMNLKDSYIPYIRAFQITHTYARIYQVNTAYGWNSGLRSSSQEM